MNKSKEVKELAKKVRAISPIIIGNFLGHAIAKMVIDDGYSRKSPPACTCPDSGAGKTVIVKYFCPRCGGQCGKDESPKVPSVEELSSVTVDFVDEFFPKNQCQERGKAIVLYAKMLIAIHKLLERKD